VQHLTMDEIQLRIFGVLTLEKALRDLAVYKG
jgi:hypothetical protein